jgi:hypothetical protein
MDISAFYAHDRISEFNASTLNPESIFVTPVETKIASSWITNIKPYGSDDVFIFSTMDVSGLSMLQIESQNVVKLSGIEESKTRLLVARKDIIGQVTKDRNFYIYRQDQTADNAFEQVLRHSSLVFLAYIVWQSNNLGSFRIRSLF